MTSPVHTYRGEVPPKRFNMARYCLKAGHAQPEKPALLVVHDPAGKDIETWTYSALQQAILRTAYALRATYSLKAGSRVAIRLRNRTPYALTFFGAIAGGLVPIPLSPDLTARELSVVLADSEAAAIVLDERLPHGAFDPDLTVIAEKAVVSAAERGPSSGYADTLAEDPAFLIYTSGTTAAPKGVLHAHRSAWGRRPMYRGWYGIAPGERLMHAGSFNWTYTLGTGLTDPWANGATAIVYTGEKDPALWPRLMRDQNVSMFAAVPGVYRQILKYGDLAPGALPLLRHGLTAGETLTSAVAAEWRERTGAVLYEALGQSELSTYISSAPGIPPRPGKVGRPQPGRCVAILGYDDGTEPLPPGSEGLIAVHRSDPGLMLGYWRRPEEEREVFRGEWFIGGDAGLADTDGYIAHLGRHNDLMNAGGFRVSPAEVEQELARHPAVAEAAVAEVPVRDGVSIVAAFIVPLEGAQAGLAESLSAFASGVLAAYKCPKDYVFVQSLPKTPNGKIKRSDLKSVPRL
ncbi:MAG: class I adenylate-forming enzyme family protein [Rhodomicrobium sp.]